jgi:hypothetical protein
MQRRLVTGEASPGFPPQTTPNHRTDPGTHKAYLVDGWWLRRLGHIRRLLEPGRFPPPESNALQYRQGETISTAFVESTINQVVSRRFVKKQQMQWSLKGVHLLLQTRTKVLNNELEDVFRNWYPQFRVQQKTAA